MIACPHLSQSAEQQCGQKPPNLCCACAVAGEESDEYSKSKLAAVALQPCSEVCKVDSFSAQPALSAPCTDKQTSDNMLHDDWDATRQPCIEAMDAVSCAVKEGQQQIQAVKSMRHCVEKNSLRRATFW